MAGSSLPRNPLVLTLTLDKPTHAFLTQLRSKYFPPHRNALSAHVTLFHAIPPHRFPELDHELNTVCSTQSGYEVFIGEPRKMGNHGVMVIARERPSGTAERIHRELLEALKRGLKEEKDRLTDQDMRPMGRAHVTVLNKARDEEEVDACLSEVKGVFEGMKMPKQQFGQKTGRAVGFELWEYIGGPWKPLKAYWFKGEEQQTENEAPKTP